jgi:hypothetical protein
MTRSAPLPKSTGPREKTVKKMLAAVAFAAFAALLSLALAACDRQVAAADAGPLTEEDRAAILGTLKLSADAKGQVMNECGELVTPQFLPAELGGGIAVLFAISGGPATAACYGDGSDLHLFMREATGWREVYSARGRMLVILPTSTGGLRDIADGGPGLSFPVWIWNGTRYAPAGREISDAELSEVKATYLP